jgi:Type VI secretion system (T6SS), amidase immunity protein
MARPSPRSRHLFSEAASRWLRRRLAAATAVFLATLAFPLDAGATGSAGYSEAMTAKYSQKALLKNWALSVCLAQVAEHAAERDDANATAGAYLEFGHQPIEAYEQIQKLVQQYAARKYAGSVDSEFNTMKCIDLVNSEELDVLTDRLSKTK